MENLTSTLALWFNALTWKEGVEAFFVGMSMLGQHFISKRQDRGFYYWIAGNVAALILFAYLGRWMTCVLYLYFTFKCVEGIRTWSKLDQTPAISTSVVAPRY